MLPQLETLIARARRRGGAAVRRAHAGRAAVRRRVPRLRRRSIPNFRFVPCFSRELPGRSPQAHADVRHGYVQQFLDEFAPNAGARHRLPVRQSEHGRRLLRGAEGRRPAGAADPPREVRQQQVSATPSATPAPARGASSGSATDAPRHGPHRSRSSDASSSGMLEGASPYGREDAMRNYPWMDRRAGGGLLLSACNAAGTRADAARRRRRRASSARSRSSRARWQRRCRRRASTRSARRSRCRRIRRNPTAARSR